MPRGRGGGREPDDRVPSSRNNLHQELEADQDGPGDRCDCGRGFSFLCLYHIYPSSRFLTSPCPSRWMEKMPTWSIGRSGRSSRRTAGDLLWCAISGGCGAALQRGSQTSPAQGWSTSSLTSSRSAGSPGSRCLTIDCQPSQLGSAASPSCRVLTSATTSSSPSRRRSAS